MTDLAITRRSLHGEAVDRLRDLIVEGNLAPGTHLREVPLCQQLGISRTPLREAIRVLSAEGLLEVMPNRGARVAAVTQSGIIELFEVVGGLERLAIECAAARIPDSEIRELEELHRVMADHHKNRNLKPFIELNHVIHYRIVAASANRTLVGTHAMLMAKARQTRVHVSYSDARWDESMTEHEAIMQALSARNGELAGRLLSDHIRRIGQVAGDVVARQTTASSVA